MTQVISFAPRPMEAAQVHPHMDLNKAVHEAAPQSVFAPRRSPSPSRSGLIRKRAASLNASDPNNHGLFDQLSINTAVAMKPDGARDTICLCTPTPKIPRPRNAFILYRQHHQSQVTADNPKLSNPEISKIIGEKWKHEVDDVKDTWKRLAEEEKQRHQHQYPNYRYQPRRGSKAQGNWPGTPTSDEQGRCPKCNGRSIATPRTPSTPIATPPSSKPGLGSQTAPALSRLDTTTPRRMSMDLSPVGTLPPPHQLAPVRAMEDGEISPGMKRRRANGAGNYHAVARNHGSYGEAPADPLRTSPEAVPHHSRRVYPPTTLPELSAIPRSHSGPMPPPPRPPGSSGWGEPDNRGRRHSGFDESLRLPPLQTSLSPTHTRTSSLDIRPPMLPSPNFELPSPDDSRSGSLEESVMAIPLKRKLDHLSRISRPCPVSAVDCQPGAVRGAFIAVEGPNHDMLQDISHAVERSVLAGNNVYLRTWVGEAETADNARTDENPKNRQNDGEQDDESTFQAYFRLVMSWQEKSKQISKHVTNDVYASSQQTPGSSGADAPSKEFPVALVKDGFSLTLADKFACSIPIADWFSPQDHWQWMASLWRGVPSPDLIVYVSPSSEEEIKQLGAVDLSKQMGLMTVRIPASKGLDEATERRMAFELSEWMREGAFRDEVPKSWRIE